MSPEHQLYPLARLGPIKNQLLVYALIAALLLFIFAENSDGALRSVLMILAALMLFLGPAFWIFAYLRLPKTAQERVFLENTVELVVYDKLQRNQR